MKQQVFFMEKLRQNKVEQTAKDTFEKGGLGTDLPEIRINISEVKKRNKYFRFLFLKIKFYLLRVKQEERL